MWCWCFYCEGTLATSAQWTGDAGLVMVSGCFRWWVSSSRFFVMLEDRQEDRDDDAGDEDRGDQSPVADVLVGHVEAGEGRDEEADGYQEKEDLQG